MTNLAPLVNQLLVDRHSAPAIATDRRHLATETINEFLKEAYRINSHINSLLHYLQSIRQSYLSTTTVTSHHHHHHHHGAGARAAATASRSQQQRHSLGPVQNLTDQDRDSIDSSTALLLRDLSASITNLASAEQLRQETETRLLQKKYGKGNMRGLFRWAAGDDRQDEYRSVEQEREEEGAKTIRAVRESVLWYLRRELESAAEVQRGMVEKRIERAKEKEKSVLYKMRTNNPKAPPPPASPGLASGESSGVGSSSFEGIGGAAGNNRSLSDPVSMMTAEEVADIESQLSPEQLQLFAEENNFMLKQYEDTLSKVQNAEKSLVEISSLQQTLVGHLATQEDYVNQLVTDASTTHENVGRGNRELKRATERRSTAQIVFWSTVGLCTWLVVWDAIF